MEDDDKSRRNLMVVSACILLYLWLDVPANALQKRILGIDDFTIEPWKFWTTLLFAVIYQLHRFVTLTVTSNAWKEHRDERDRYLRAALVREAAEAVAWANAHSRLPATLAWAEGAEAKELPFGTLSLMSEEIAPVQLGSRRWKVHIKVKSETYNASIDGREWVLMKCTIPRRIEMNRKLRWSARQLTKAASTEFWLPLAFGCIAAALSAWNLQKVLRAFWS
ncbi:hypothetical protein [Roseateles sp. MS654]|uniref:hypothetical protein n=1 Tax=Roseateles sp. MS654 TaxID=3412685 RepID=UPI003C2CA6A0